MKILFVWPQAEFSIWDVARGYRRALQTAGHEVRDYALNRYVNYHRDALLASPDPALAESGEVVTRQATESVLAQALFHDADLVIITSGLAFHPNGLWLLRRAGIPTLTLFTESPYEDEHQRDFAAFYPEMRCTTNERTSARREGWTYLAHAYDPTLHHPTAPLDGVEPSDVLLVGTGWSERLALLTEVDWTGIRLDLRGLWEIPEGHPLQPFYRGGCVDNEQMPALYATTKIAINLHRRGDGAESLNPRAFEMAACGVFQLSDHRAELADVFGDTVPVFASPRQLGEQIRCYLAHPDEREVRAHEQHAAVINGGHTFDARVRAMMDTVAPWLAAWRSASQRHEVLV